MNNNNTSCCMHDFKSLRRIYVMYKFLNRSWISILWRIVVKYDRYVLYRDHKDIKVNVLIDGDFDRIMVFYRDFDRNYTFLKLQQNHGVTVILSNSPPIHICTKAFSLLGCYFCNQIKLFSNFPCYGSIINIILFLWKFDEVVNDDNDVLECEISLTIRQIWKWMYETWVILNQSLLVLLSTKVCFYNSFIDL
jgi:hypothetical protein